MIIGAYITLLLCGYVAYVDFTEKDIAQIVLDADNQKTGKSETSKGYFVSSNFHISYPSCIKNGFTKKIIFRSMHSQEPKHEVICENIVE